MKEGAFGAARRAGERDLPRDSELYDKTNSYTAHISRGGQSLIIDTTEYHPGQLTLEKEDLERILRYMSE